MCWTPLRILMIGIACQVAFGSVSVWAESAHSPTTGSVKIDSADTGAVLMESSGMSGRAINSHDLSEFDSCRARIDFTSKSIDQVRSEVEKCRKTAIGKSAELADPNFSDIKLQIQKQTRQIQTR